MENYKIVADSSADMTELPDIPFASAPLKIIAGDKQYVDNAELDVETMIRELETHKGKSSTSCPNVEDWLQAFSDAEHIFCVPITRGLSGSYNTANLAKEIYEAQHPERHVFVVDSLTAGPEMRLLVEKLSEMISAEKDYETICREIMEYKKTTGIVFMLESVHNFANNGRINPILAKAIGLLGIRILAKGSDKGEIEPVDKCRGQEKALRSIVRYLREHGLKLGKVRISHCFNENGANRLKEMLCAELSQIKIEIHKCRGLCSFYAERGGLLIGFEKC